MADRLASIHGTEQDRVNCPFYFKVGACRHGDRCSRQHNKPLFSQTVLLAHMYQAPQSATMQQGPTALSTAADDKPGQEHFDDYFEEVWLLCARLRLCAPSACSTHSLFLRPVSVPSFRTLHQTNLAPAFSCRCMKSLRSLAKLRS